MQNLMLNCSHQVVNKPPSFLIYPASSNRLNTVLFILAKERGHLDLRPVHRLDKNTSGVCIMAKVRFESFYWEK